jgi:hypothetical protein
VQARWQCWLCMVFSINSSRISGLHVTWQGMRDALCY